MSKEQWGHGFHTGIEAAKKELRKDFPIGYCFHVMGDDGHVDYSGVVVSRSGDVFLARYFSAWTGCQLEDVHPFKMEDTKGWRWYESGRDMRAAYARIERWDEASIRCGELMVKMAGGI